MGGFVLGVLSTVVLGVLVDLVTGSTTTLLRRLRIRAADSRAIKWDVRPDGLYVAAEWSSKRPIKPSTLDTQLAPKGERHDQTFVDSTVLKAAVAARAHDTGDIAYLTGVRINHTESEETEFCRVGLAEADYSEVRAIEYLREVNPDALLAADAAVATSVRDYLQGPVPSSLAVNVIPMTADGELLCAERSSAVDNGVGMWTVGVYETMKPADKHFRGREENFFSLTQRALEEELGLAHNDYGPIELTWLGIYRPLLRGHLVAVTRLNIDKAEVEERRKSADSRYEHVQLDWIKLNRTTVQEFTRGPKRKATAENAEVIWVKDRGWIDQARLAVLEAWRYQSILLTD